MYTKGAEVKAGVVVLVALAALLGMLFFGGGAQPLWRDYRFVHLRFEQGYTAPKAGDSVYMNGAIVGQVHRVHQEQQVYTRDELTPEVRARLGMGMEPADSARELYVLCVVKMPAEQVIPRGTSAQIERSLTGGRTLSFKPGTSVENLTDAETHASPIPAREAVGIEDIMRTVKDLVGKVSEFVEGGGEVLDEARVLLRTIREKVDALDATEINDDIKAAVGSIKRSLQDLEKRLGPIAQDVGDAAANLKTISDVGTEVVAEVKIDLDQFMTTLQQVAERLDRILAKAEPKIDTILDDIAAVSKNLVELSQEFGGIGPDARRLLDEFGSDLDLLMKTLQDTVRNLADASEDLRANPWKLTNKPDADEIAYDNVRSAALSYLRAMRDLDEISRTLNGLLKRTDLDDEGVKARVAEALEEFAETQRRVKRTETRFQQLLSAERPPDGRGGGRRR